MFCRVIQFTVVQFLVSFDLVDDSSADVLVECVLFSEVGSLTSEAYMCCRWMYNSQSRGIHSLHSDTLCYANATIKHNLGESNEKSRTCATEKAYQIIFNIKMYRGQSEWVRWQPFYSTYPLNA